MLLFILFNMKHLASSDLTNTLSNVPYDFVNIQQTHKLMFCFYFHSIEREHSVWSQTNTQYVLLVFAFNTFKYI